jgi:Cu+-exporting ATPase
VKAEVDKYRARLFTCLLLYLPIAFMVWVVPYVHSLKPLMIYVKLIRGNTLFVLLLFLMATYIQFVMGKHFY